MKGKRTWTRSLRQAAVAMAGATALLLGGTGCGKDGGRVTAADSRAARTGPPLSVAEAKRSGLAGPVRVRGAFVADRAGRTWLCEALAESQPPQCGGERLEVRGVDSSRLELTRAGAVSFRDSVELVGVVQGHVFVVLAPAGG